MSTPAAADLLSVSETAAVLRRSEYFVRDELKRKELRGTKVGRRWSIKRTDLDKYIEARMNLARIRGRAS